MPLLALPAQAQDAPGCTLIADAATGKIMQQEGACETRVTAASTFKIAISLMGYDAGFLKDEHTPVLSFHPGYPAWNPAWRTDIDPTSWIKNSVFWYSQQVTRSLGEARFQHYVQAFHYGNEDVSGDPGKHDGLTDSWNSSSLKISPLEEAAFLEKIAQRTLPVSTHAYDMTDRLTEIATLPNGWDVHGKTGTGFPRDATGAEDHAHGYGWFVGWATKEGRTLVFVRQIQDTEAHKDGAGLRAREAFLQKLPALLDQAQ
ncbi:class D beta-lactamase [Methylovirgula sp. 4M-Z18]|nr:class D beta-lactamase [Methylovirgula sp. 4M-Z18]